MHKYLLTARTVSRVFHGPTIHTKIEGHDQLIIINRLSYGTIQSLKNTVFNHLFGEDMTDPSIITESSLFFRPLTGFGYEGEFVEMTNDALLNEAIHLGISQGLYFRVVIVCPHPMAVRTLYT